MTTNQRRQKQKKKKTQTTVFPALAAAFALGVAQISEANIPPRGAPSPTARAPPTPRPAAAARPANDDANSADSTMPEGENRPIITIHSAGNILREKTGSFVLKMSPPLAFGGMYVNFKLSGTAVQGVDYISPRAPAYIGKSGYGVISLKTLADPRGTFYAKNYT